MGSVDVWRRFGLPDLHSVSKPPDPRPRDQRTIAVVRCRMARADFMKTSVIRRIVFCLIAMWAFGQAAVALAACSMERGAPMQMTQTDGTCDCGNEGQS